MALTEFMSAFPFNHLNKANDRPPSKQVVTARFRTMNNGIWYPANDCEKRQRSQASVRDHFVTIPEKSHLRIPSDQWEKNIISITINQDTRPRARNGFLNPPDNPDSDGVSLEFRDRWEVPHDHQRP